MEKREGTLMNPDIEKLKEKHKAFLKKINAELIKENDFNGNYHRLDDYLNDLKGKKVKNKKEKELLLKKMRDDNYAEVAHQDYLDQLDGPRWYLEKTYPIFYKHFKSRFERFIDSWKKAIKTEKFDDNFLKDLFVHYCDLIGIIIKANSEFTAVVEEVERVGLPSTEERKISLTRSLYEDILDLLFEVPDTLILSFNKPNSDYENVFRDKHKANSIYSGNVIEDRKNGNAAKYMQIAKLIKVMEMEFKNLKGLQTIACNIVGCSVTSFNRWLNSIKKATKSKENHRKFMSWQENITPAETEELKTKINSYLKG